MSIIGDILGSKISTDITNAGYTILDNIYSYNAIWLQDAQQIFNIPSLSSILGTTVLDTIPLPLIGFAYRLDGEIGLLSYEWSQYPYLSKQIITNAGIKQAVKFAVNVYSVFSDINPVALNIFKIQKIVELLDQYVAKGGLFTVLTMFGNMTDCVLEKIDGVSGNGPDGTELKFSFLKPNINNVQSVTQQVSNLVSKLNSGAALRLGGF